MSIREVDIMIKYKDMYYMLFNEVSDAIDKLENGIDTKSVIENLKKAQQNTEEIYISSK